MKNKILSIQSISDIITNSSTEVFVINANNDAVIELINSIDKKNASYYLNVLKTEDDVKKYLIETIKTYGIIDDIDGFIGCNVLNTIADYYSFKKLEKEGVELEKIVDVFFPLYKCLVGHIVLSFEDDGGYPEWINDLTALARNNNLISFFDRG